MDIGRRKAPASSALLRAVQGRACATIPGLVRPSQLGSLGAFAPDHPILPNGLGVGADFRHVEKAALHPRHGVGGESKFGGLPCLPRSTHPKGATHQASSTVRHRFPAGRSSWRFALSGCRIGMFMPACRHAPAHRQPRDVQAIDRCVARLLQTPRRRSTRRLFNRSSHERRHHHRDGRRRDDEVYRTASGRGRPIWRPKP
jgi:hypothetical protein